MLNIKIYIGVTRQPAMGKICLLKNSCGHFLLQAGTYVISSPYMIRFHIRGGAKNKNQFFWHFWAKKVNF